MMHLTKSEVAIAVSIAADADPDEYADIVKAVVYKCRTLVTNHPDGSCDIAPFKIKR
jgi:hypothetical protein